MTPAEVHRQLVALFPNFASYWNSPENHFREEDGTFTTHGVFAEFSHFVRERLPELPSEALGKLGQFLEQCLASPEPSNLRNAAETCFLENLAGEDFTPTLAAHFGERARKLLSDPGPFG